jgi:predicted GNAT family acetyltransferase
MTEPSILGPEHAAELESFLRERAETSMFLRSNLRRAGMVDRGQPYQGTYVAWLEGGRITGVVAHYWSGFVSVQAEREPGALLRRALATSSRKVVGVSGPYAQVQAVIEQAGLADRRRALDGREVLFILELARMQVPAELASGAVRCRKPAEADLPGLIAWRAAYMAEALGQPASAETQATAAREVPARAREGGMWMLEAEGRPVAMTSFNAELPDMVQVGGVYTPPELRGRGYGRAVVAGSLLEARATGVARSVLFTGHDNLPAQAAYRALGYQAKGEFALVMF